MTPQDMADLKIAAELIRQLWPGELAFERLSATLRRLAKEETVKPDMRAICETLGFDPTNHHNAAKCPYCNPANFKE